MIWVYEDCKINFWSSYAFSFSAFRARIVFRSAIQKTTKIHINSKKLWIIKFLCNSRAEACAFNAQTNAVQKINFAIKDFFSNQIRQETAYFVIFTEEILTGNFHYLCSETEIFTSAKLTFFNNGIYYLSFYENCNTLLLQYAPCIF